MGLGYRRKPSEAENFVACAVARLKLRQSLELLMISVEFAVNSLYGKKVHSILHRSAV